MILKASVCNFYQNFNIHILRCDFLYIHDDNNICGQKLNRNRKFFNPRSICQTLSLKWCVIWVLQHSLSMLRLKRNPKSLVVILYHASIHEHLNISETLRETYTKWFFLVVREKNMYVLLLRPFKIDCMFCISSREIMSFLTTDARVNFWGLCFVFAPAHSISKISWCKTHIQF